MAITVLLTHASSRPPSGPRHVSFDVSHRLPKQSRRVSVVSGPFNLSSFRIISFQCRDVESAKASSSGNTSPNGGDGVDNEIFEDWKVEPSNPGSSFLAKLAIVLGIAATITVVSVFLKRPTLGSSSGFPFIVDASSSSVSAPSVGFTLKAFGYKVILPEYTPGWIYFWLLMAAGCGLFISEEALNIWVGISLARTLSLDGTWKSFMESFSNNAPYIISTVLWVYWGVCISDMVPFYLGKLVRQTKASDNVLSKLGIGKEKALNITRAVQKYGNLIGFVERFSFGVRNPTSFLAGALLGIGFLLRERPLVAIASVATAVAIWTFFPYAVAASTALFLFLRRRQSS
ncbi:uncharacterized protein LOC131246439 isoform X2 [Magnolia sinica]|uniref:uncharacterized protein LOC131246439 isoform X2 n=1 Tax=Magnolia sinica TaxID=86752 RepID=UPI00265A7779|nr:uncharacterized protein LOC131246439 isoform X2 [Magnolia sinica]